MKVSRRKLAKVLTALAVAGQSVLAQTPQVTPQAAPPAAPKPSADQDLEQAKAQLRANFATVARVKLPMSAEPSFQFKA